MRVCVCVCLGEWVRVYVGWSVAIRCCAELPSCMFPSVVPEPPVSHDGACVEALQEKSAQFEGIVMSDEDVFGQVLKRLMFWECSRKGRSSTGWGQLALEQMLGLLDEP